MVRVPPGSREAYVEVDGSVESDELVVGSSRPAGRSARVAFRSGDVEASRAAHSAHRPPLEGFHGVHRCRALGHGAFKGFAAAFASGLSLGTLLIAAARGARLPDEHARALGLALVLGYALASACGCYLRRRSEQDSLWEEFRREQWEWKHNPEGEKKEMVELYESEGLKKAHAEKIIGLLSLYPKKFIDVMMVEELRLLPPTSEEPLAVLPHAVWDFAGTALGGLLAVLASLRVGAAGMAGLNSGPASAVGLFLAAWLAGGLQALGFFKGAECQRVYASALFYAICLTTLALATFALARELSYGPICGAAAGVAEEAEVALASSGDGSA